MQNKKLIILIVLGVMAITSLIYGIITPSKVKRGIMSTREDISKRGSDAAIEIGSSVRQASRSGYTSWGRSPFVPIEVFVKRLHRFTLNGIVWDKASPRAIINNNIVRIGDKIEDATVVDIEKEKVILNDGIKDFDLKLGE